MLYPACPLCVVSFWSSSLRLDGFAEETGSSGIFEGKNETYGNSSGVTVDFYKCVLLRSMPVLFLLCLLTQFDKVLISCNSVGGENFTAVRNEQLFSQLQHPFIDIHV